jgi:small subunit ribosomal protein S17
MRIFTGRVVGLTQQKTATVAVERIKVDPVYKKRFKRSSKYHVHDELGVKIGDVVRFVPSRPFSKTKNWKILEVVGAKKATDRKGGKKEK